jgi:hypothetical protein
LTGKYDIVIEFDKNAPESLLAPEGGVRQPPSKAHETTPQTYPRNRTRALTPFA